METFLSKWEWLWILGVKPTYRRHTPGTKGTKVVSHKLQVNLLSPCPLFYLCLLKIPKNEWFWFPILRFFSKVYKQNQKNYWSLVLATFHSDTKWEELETSSPLAAPSATGRQTCLRRRSWANSIQPSPIWSTPLPSPMPGTSAGQSESLVNLENSWRKEFAGPEYLCLPRKSVCGESCKV